MRPLPKSKHVPSTEIGDCGDAIRQRAAEATGFEMGQDAITSREQMMRRGGAEAVIDRVVKRIERGNE